MKKRITLLMFCAIQNVTSTPLLEPEIYERYRVDSSMKALLDEHKDELIKAFRRCDKAICIKKHRAYEFPWLPGYLVKKHISRIIGAERLLSSIKENDLDLLVVPEKRLYEVDGIEFIIVTKIEAISGSSLTLRQVQQLWKLIEETGYCDIKKPNYLFMADDKIAIIDTERRSFGYKPFRAFAKFLMNLYPFDYTEDAFRFVLANLRNYIPEDIHNIPIPSHFITREERYSYPRVYESIEKNLREAPDVFEWDYYSYFKEHYPNPFEDSNQ